MRSSAELCRVAHQRACTRCSMPGTQHPAPSYPKDANSSWTEAYVSHMSGHAQKAQEIHRIEIRRIPRAFKVGRECQPSRAGTRRAAA